MNFLSGIMAMLILGSLSEFACGQSAEFNKTVAETYKQWGKHSAYVKRCNRFEVLGFCPEKQLTVCVLGHVVLRTRKMCDYCSVSKWYAYKYGKCPDDVLLKIAAKEGIQYQGGKGTPHELKRQLNFLRRYKQREKQNSPGFDINFPTGSEQENPEPIELGIAQYTAPKNNTGRSSTDMLDLEFLESIADKKKAILAKIAKKATMDKLKGLLQEIGDLL